MRKGSWIQLHSGHAFYPLDPRSEEFTLTDIAHGLSLENRFSGHSRDPYSVAEHSVRVSILMEELANNYEWALPEVVNAAMVGLAHDGEEALGWRDIARPIKHQPEFEFYRQMSDRCQTEVWLKFGVFLNPEVSALTHKADAVLLATEKRDLMGAPMFPWGALPNPLPEKITPWPWQVAEIKFIARYEELKNRRELLASAP